MKQLFWILALFLTSCCGSKSKTSMVEAQTTEADKQNLPICVKELIKKNEAQDRQNPPIKIYSYKYNGSIVYYETAACCDMYSNLYNSTCELMGHPDGGFTGRGDGKYPDFAYEAKDQKLIWEDKREEKKY